MTNCQSIESRTGLLQDSITQAKSLNELMAILREADDYQPMSYGNYIYPAFGGEPIHPNDISYFKAYEDGLDISSVCFDILSWDDESILFILGYGMILDLSNDRIIASKVPQPDNYDFWITKREYVEKYSVDIACPLCNKVNRIMPDYSVQICKHVIASHVFGELIWHNSEVEKQIVNYLSKPISTVDSLDEINEEEDDDGVCHYWSVLHEHVHALMDVYPQVKFMEVDAFGLGYCDVAGFAFLPSDSFSSWHS